MSQHVPLKRAPSRSSTRFISRRFTCEKMRICLVVLLDRMNTAELLSLHKNFVILEDQVEDQLDITHM